MKYYGNQSGSALIYALVILTIITTLAVYLLEGSNIQSKMVANSLYSNLTYQDCKNEQEAQIVRFNYNSDPLQKREDLSRLLNIAEVPTEELKTDKYKTILNELNTIESNIDNQHPPKSEVIIEWSYIRNATPDSNGYGVDTEEQRQAYLYELTCDSNLSFSKNKQTLGATVKGLKQAGIMN